MAPIHPELSPNVSLHEALHQALNCQGLSIQGIALTVQVRTLSTLRYAQLNSVVPRYSYPWSCSCSSSSSFALNAWCVATPMLRPPRVLHIPPDVGRALPRIPVLNFWYTSGRQLVLHSPQLSNEIKLSNDKSGKLSYCSCCHSRTKYLSMEPTYR